MALRKHCANGDLPRTHELTTLPVAASSTTMENLAQQNCKARALRRSSATPREDWPGGASGGPGPGSRPGHPLNSIGSIS
jgi:hypothetical protein